MLCSPERKPGSEFVNSASLFWAVVGSAAYPTLESAVAAWNQLPPNSAGTIVLPEFRKLRDRPYRRERDSNSGGELAADCFGRRSRSTARRSGTTRARRCAATSRLWLRLCALGPDGLALPVGTVQISGVWLSGQLILSGDEASRAGGRLDSRARHCPRLERRGRASRRAQRNRIGARLHALPQPGRSRVRSRCRRPARRASATELWMRAPQYRPAFAGNDFASPGATLHVENSTIIGRVWAQAIRLASNTIFYARLGKRDPWQAPVWAARVQAGLRAFLLAAGRLHCAAAVRVSPAGRDQRTGARTHVRHAAFRQAGLLPAQRRCAHGRVEGRGQRLADGRLLPDSGDRSGRRIFRSARRSICPPIWSAEFF